MRLIQYLSTALYVGVAFASPVNYRCSDQQQVSLRISRPSHALATDPTSLILELTTEDNLLIQVEETAASLSGTNFFSNMPRIIQGLQEVIRTDQQASADLDDAKYNDADAKQVKDAFKTQNNLAQSFLKALTAKSNLISITPFKSPLSAVLRAWEGTFGHLGYQLVDLNAADKKSTEDVLAALNKAIDTFSS